jgi:hypothetical protein
VDGANSIHFLGIQLQTYPKEEMHNEKEDRKGTTKHAKTKGKRRKEGRGNAYKKRRSLFI